MLRARLCVFAIFASLREKTFCASTRHALFQCCVSINYKLFPFFDRAVRPTHAHCFYSRRSRPIQQAHADRFPKDNCRQFSLAAAGLLLSSTTISTCAPNISRPAFPTSRNPNQWFRFPT